MWGDRSEIVCVCVYVDDETWIREEHPQGRCSGECPICNLCIRGSTVYNHSGSLRALCVSHWLPRWTSVSIENRWSLSIGVLHWRRTLSPRVSLYLATNLTPGRWPYSICWDNHVGPVSQRTGRSVGTCAPCGDPSDVCTFMPACAYISSFILHDAEDR